MRLIIDIPEDYYEIVKHDVQVGNDYLPFKLIAKGTPLPKGHGRLIDADALISEIKDLKKSPWYKDNTNFSYLPRKETLEIIEDVVIRDAPTIVEEEKEEEDGTN